MNKIILNEDNKKLFLQINPDFVDDKKLNIFYNRIEYLLNNIDNLINDIKTNGFNEDFTDINLTKWFSYISKIIVHIENIKNINDGEEKLELLIAFITVIIINFIPTSNDIKKILINKLIDIIPDIADSIISASKQIHKFTFKILKILKKKLCKCIK